MYAISSVQQILILQYFNDGKKIKTLTLVMKESPVKSPLIIFFCAINMNRLSISCLYE